MRIIVFCIFCFACLVSNAQSIEEIYASAHKKLESSENISYKLSFISKSQTTVLSKQGMKIEKHGKNFYSKIGQVESYMFGSTSVVIDHESEVVLVNEGVTAPPNNGLLQKLNMLEALEKEAVNSKIDTVGNKLICSMYFSGQEFKYISFEVDQTSGWFHKLSFKLSQPYQITEAEESLVSTIDVVFENYDHTLNEFSRPISSYLKKSDGRYSLQQEYSHYQFVKNYD